MITVRSTINLAHQSVPEVIPAVQGDTGRSILFSLADFTIPTGATARYFITKPSGLSVYNDATIDGNTVLVDLTAQSLAEYGDCPGQVRISVGDTVVTSFEFILHVEHFRGIDAVQSLVEMNIFDQMVTGAVDEAREQIEDAAEEVIETIPEDYTALTENVDGLNETIYNLAEAQGNPAIIYDGADNIPVKDLKITFSASSNVNRIQVVRSGKNLVVDKLANGAVDGDGKYTNNSKRITNSFTSTYPISRTWLKAGTYTLSVPGLSACTVVIKTDSTTVAHAWALEQTLPFTFTTQTDGYFIFSARNSANIDISPSDYHAQLEAGAKATAYEPARVQKVTTILYPLTVSSGVLDFTTGQLTSGGSVYAVDAADISTVEGYNRIDAYMMSSSTGYMASTTSMDVIYRRNVYAWDSLLNVIPTETAQGNPASFDDGADEIPVKDLKVSIVPHQDLHGYDKPWAGGAGKNLLNYDAWKTVDAYRCTLQWVDNGVTITATGNDAYTKYSDADNYPASARIPVSVGETIIMTWETDTTENGRVFIFPNGSESGLVSTTATAKQLSYTGGSNVSYVSIRFGVETSGKTIAYRNIMVRKSTDSATFEPYSNICPITGMTEVEVERTGFNQWDEEWELGIYDWTNGTGSKIAGSGNLRCKNFIKCLPNTNYYVSMSSVGIYVLFYDGNHSYLSYTTFTSAQQITTPASCQYMTFYRYQGYGTTYNNDISINLPSTDHDYHAYQGTSLSIPLGRTVYGGTLDVTTGVLTVDRAIFSPSALQLYGNYGDDNKPLYYFDIDSYVKEYWNSTMNPEYKLYSNKYVCITTVTQQAMPNNCIRTQTTNSGRSNRIYLRDDRFASLTDANADLTLHPLQVLGVLDAPITYQLTPQELLSVLGTNHISTDAESVDVEYRADIKLYIENLTKPGDDDMVANNAITSGKFFMIGNRLFLSTASIANGATITPGTNATELSLSEALNTLNS